MSRHNFGLSEHETDENDMNLATQYVLHGNSTGQRSDHPDNVIHRGDHRVPVLSDECRLYTPAARGYHVHRTIYYFDYTINIRVGHIPYNNIFALDDPVFLVAIMYILYLFINKDILSLYYIYLHKFFFPF